VLWLQEHLAREFPSQPTTGLFGSLTLGFLRAFQASHRLPVTGGTDAATWQALLRLRPVATSWSVVASAARTGTRTRAPQSASLPARRYEIREIGSDRAPAGSPAEP
jgi:peptidoglycan hydrolase-like protein with peptidoglycan-binding domain